MSRHQVHVATSHTAAHVATSNPCRDVVSAHSGISKSRRRNPCRDLPYCCPCHDLKNDVATSNQLSPISATSRRHFSMLRRPLLSPMSRHQNHVATSSCSSRLPPSRNLKIQVAILSSLNQVATSNLGRDPTLEFGSSHSSFCPTPKKKKKKFFSNPPVAFLPATPLMQ